MLFPLTLTSVYSLVNKVLSVVECTLSTISFNAASMKFKSKQREKFEENLTNKPSL